MAGSTARSILPRVFGGILHYPLPDGGMAQVVCLRHPRARRLKLSVDERGARLSLPSDASIDAGERFLHRHRHWLAEQLRHQAELTPEPLRAGVTSTLPLHGQARPLRWFQGRIHRLHRDGEALAFEIPAEPDDGAIRRALCDFYLAQARADISHWLPGHLSGLPRPPCRITLKRMRSRWGSLAPGGAMALDLALTLAQPSAFEYVLVHELCHLIHPDHSPAFWREVERRVPHWRGEHDHLRHEGRRLKTTLRALTLPPATLAMTA